MRPKDLAAIIPARERGTALRRLRLVVFWPCLPELVVIENQMSMMSGLRDPS